MKINPMLITNIVSDHFKVNPVDVLGTRRKREFVKARHISMYFIDQLIEDTLDNKASLFGKSHDDIIFARHSVNNQADIYRFFRQELLEIREKIEGKSDMDFGRYLQYDTDLT